MTRAIDHKYKNPPIVEAMIEIHVLPENEKTPLDVAAELSRILGSFLPRKNQIPGLKAKTSSMSGVRFIGANDIEAVDIYPRQFIYRARQYDGWESFKKQALSYWMIFKDWVGESKIERIAVRYTNRFDVDIELAKYDDLFFPSIDDPLKKNQDLLSYTLQNVIYQPDINAVVSMQRGIIDPKTPHVVSVVLDIDIYTEYHGESQYLSHDDLWPMFEQLHTRGKEYFEASITDRLREELDK